MERLARINLYPCGIRLLGDVGIRDSEFRVRGTMRAFGARGQSPSPAANADGSLPSPRARSAWRGGVGGGGCFSVLNISMGTRCTTPHPRPLPAAARGEGRRA